MADRQYELVYILPPDSTEQQVAELHTQIEGAVSKMHGAIEKTENWGRRKLAYEIGHNKEGVYVLDVINGSGDLMKELDRRLRTMDQVIRHMVVRVDEEDCVLRLQHAHHALADAVSEVEPAHHAEAVLRGGRGSGGGSMTWCANMPTAWT